MDQKAIMGTIAQRGAHRLFSARPKTDDQSLTGIAAKSNDCRILPLTPLSSGFYEGVPKTEPMFSIFYEQTRLLFLRLKTKDLRPPIQHIVVSSYNGHTTTCCGPSDTQRDVQEGYGTTEGIPLRQVCRERCMRGSSKQKCQPQKDWHFHFELKMTVLADQNLLPL
jgi:hypothetical protein